MPIKPLESKNNWSVFLKLMLLGGLMMGAVVINKIFTKKNQDIPSVLGTAQEIKQINNSNLIKDSIKKAEEVGGVILGETTDTFNKLTSDAGSFVSKVVYENSIGKIVEQVDKLPKDQQEKIREQICK